MKRIYRKSYLLVISVFLALLLNSCQEASINPYVPGPPEKYPTIADFPNTVGSWWEYEVYDSLNSYFDYIHVEITSEIKNPNGQKATIWQYTTRGQLIQEDIVAIEGDTVKIYNYFMVIDSLTNFSVKNLIVFPLKVGSSWISSVVEMKNEIYYGDSTWVERKYKKSVPAGDFDGAYEIVSGTRGIYPPYESITFYPGVGILNKTYNYFKEGNNLYYNLVNYHIE